MDEVIIDVERTEQRAHLTLRWRGGALTELRIPLPHYNHRTIHTDEDTLSLLRRLAEHYPDAVIAGILNRQGRRSATGQRFTATIISGLRGYRHIPRYQPPAEPPSGEVVTVTRAARILGVAQSTLLRWLLVGFIAGE